MKFALKVTSGPQDVGQVFQLDPQQTYGLGRVSRPGVHFVLAGDPRISSRHFEIRCGDSDCVLTDVGSSNGTYVNGERGTQFVVRPSDQIRIGETTLEVVATGVQSAPGPLPGESPRPNQSYGNGGASDALRCTEPLRVIPGNGVERRIDAGAGLTVGRTPRAEWVFPSDPRMSSLHFAIESSGTIWQVRDLASANGTFQNGSKTTVAPLRHGDEITAGDTTFRVLPYAPDPFDAGERPTQRTDFDKEPVAPFPSPEKPSVQASVAPPLEQRSTPPTTPTAPNGLPPLAVREPIPAAEEEIVYERFPCGSGLSLLRGPAPDLVSVDVARRLTFATQGWIISSSASAIDAANARASGISLDPLSHQDPAWMRHWLESWGKSQRVVFYTRKGPEAIERSLTTLAASSGRGVDQLVDPPFLAEFFANRLADTVNPVFDDLDAVLVELDAGGQWAIFAAADLESVLGELRFRSRHKW